MYLLDLCGDAPESEREDKKKAPNNFVGVIPTWWVDGETSEWFEVKQGYRRVLSMYIVLDMVVREARATFGEDWDWIHASCRSCCLLMIQFWQLRRTSNTPSQHIWQICHERHLADFKLGGLRVRDWWRHKMATLLRLEPSPGCFGHREVPSSPGMTVFSSVSLSLPCLQGYCQYRHRESHRASCQPLLSHQQFTSRACSPVLSPSLRECHTWAQALPSADTYFSRAISTITLAHYYVMAGNIGGV